MHNILTCKIQALKYQASNALHEIVNIQIVGANDGLPYVGKYKSIMFSSKIIKYCRYVFTCIQANHILRLSYYAMCQLVTKVTSITKLTWQFMVKSWLLFQNIWNRQFYQQKTMPMLPASGFKPALALFILTSSYIRIFCSCAYERAKLKAVFIEKSYEPTRFSTLTPWAERETALYVSRLSTHLIV